MQKCQLLLCKKMLNLETISLNNEGSPKSWFLAGTRLPARLDLGFEVRALIYYHAVFSGCSVGSAVVLCGLAIRDLVTVCGNVSVFQQWLVLVHRCGTVCQQC